MWLAYELIKQKTCQLWRNYLTLDNSVLRALTFFSCSVTSSCSACKFPLLREASPCLKLTRASASSFSSVANSSKSILRRVLSRLLCVLLSTLGKSDGLLLLRARSGCVVSSCAECDE